MSDTPADVQPPADERIAKALESIAQSLARLAHPPMLVAEVDAKLMADADRRPGSITYVDRFGRPTSQPDRTA